MNTPENKPPVSVRVAGEDRKLLEELSEGGTASSVMLQGLRMLGSLRGGSELPLYPRCVEDADVADTIDRAAKAACEVLDELFVGKPPETQGISSNFIGGLREHIEAMLTGRPAARRTVRLELKPLLGDYWSLGRIRGAQRNEGYCVIRPSPRLGGPDLFFHSEKKQFVELARITADSLHTAQEPTQREVFLWMQREGISPREMPMRLCLLAWDPNEDEGGPLKVAEIAR